MTADLATTTQDHEDQARVLAALERLEAPECGCKPVPCKCEGPCDCPVSYPPCEHIQAAPDHGLSVDTWATLLADANAVEYADPPRPRGPMIALSRESRVATLEMRAKAGLGLWHEADVLPDDVDHVGRDVRLTKNGRPVQGHLLTMGEDDGETDGLGVWPIIAARKDD